MKWDYFNKFDAITDKYLPARGEGQNKASQTVTAVCKLVYKWYNDGDVFDNTAYMEGWENDLSSYANWLAKYAGVKDILDRIYDCYNDEQYEDILIDLADILLDERELEYQSAQPMVGSIYDCEGDYRFEEREDEECEYEEEEIW